MLNRTLLFSVITAVVFVLPIFGAASFATAADENTLFQNEQAVFFGQSAHEARKTPSIGEQLKRMWNRILQDDSPDHSSHKQGHVAVPPAVPTLPPKPLTAAEIQQSTATNNPSQQRGVNTPQPRAGTTSPISRIGDDTSEDAERSVQARMSMMRTRVFNDPEVAKAAQHSRDTQRHVTLTPAPLFYDVITNPSGVPDDSRGIVEVPKGSISSPATDERSEIFVPAGLRNPREPSVMHGQVPQNQTGSLFPIQPTVLQPDQPVQPSGQNHIRHQQPVQPVQPIVVVEPETQREPQRQVLTSASPQLAFSIEKPPSAVVGQEIVYRIRATNVGDVAAERVVLNVEIPPWIVIRHTDADNGNWVLLPRDDGSGVADLEWRVNRINQGETNLLALRLVPQQHRAIELPMRYDFHRPTIVAIVDVQEPRLEMELIGPDEVRWNDFVTYTLVVRNVGNGSAEKLKFELSQTSTENAETTMEEPLMPGEGQEIPILVRAGREQEQIDIAVIATGAHDLKNEVRRRIKVLRPKLNMNVQTSPMHFVDEPAEMFIRVVNHGNADAENVVIRAELPLGAERITSSEGGLFVQQQQQNIVEWRGRSIAKGEMQTFSLTCIPRREGECRVSVEASESNGTPLVASHGTFMAEAIVELNLAVLRPNRPIELGEEVSYTLEVTNTGTKSAEDVEISMMFGEQLEPIAVAGRDAHYTSDGQVIFEKIPTILPKATVTLRVNVEAKGVGTTQIRAEVVRADTSGTSVRLEQGLSAHIFSRQRDSVTASGQTTQK